MLFFHQLHLVRLDEQQPCIHQNQQKNTEIPTLTSEGAVRTAVKRGLPAVGPLDAEEDLRGGKGVRVKQHTNTQLHTRLPDDPAA